MRKQILILFAAFLSALITSANAEIIATYQDIESYEAAQQRLGRAPEIGEFERYDFEVSQAQPGGQIIIAQVDASDPIEPEPEPEPSLFDRTSRAQMLGCLQRWDNQLNSGSVTTVLNSLSSMFDDKETINYCIEDIRAIVQAAEK